ncbi:MAG: zinc ribbon domain-containing protein [Oscillospiraceae bacterium]|nr:zinc ribbon domain-containing protein [Oscillospiraceae bacterium]
MQNQNFNTVCPKCNAINGKDTNFCGSCGNSLRYVDKSKKIKTFPVWAIVLLILTVIFYILSGIFGTIGGIFTALAEDGIYLDENNYEGNPDDFDFYDKFDKYFENYINPQNPQTPQTPDDSSSQDSGYSSPQSSPSAYLDGVPVYGFSETLIIEDVEFTLSYPYSKKDESGNIYSEVIFSIYNNMSDSTLSITPECFSLLGLNDMPPIDCSMILNNKDKEISRKLLFPGESLTGHIRFNDCDYSPFDAMLYCNFKIDGRKVEFFVKDSF